MSNSDGMSNLGKALLDQYLAPANARTKRANERLEAAKEAARIADENAKQALENLFVSIQTLVADFETVNVALAQSQAENRALQAKIDAALAIEPPSLSQSVNAPFARGQSAMRAEFRKALEGKG